MYDLTADDEVIWGWGLGCNGAIEVFVEPGDKAAEVADALALALEEERSIAVATVIETGLEGVPTGARLLVHPGGVEGGVGVARADEAIGVAAASALATGATAIVPIALGGAELRVFIEVLQPPLRMLVCGAGHDAIPLVRAASALGWRVVVVDDRDAFLDEQRFPGATGFVAAPPAEVAAAAGVDGRTYAVVMSHNYLRDRDYLRSLLGTEVGYIGMLGPNARLERLLEDLGRDGVVPSAGDLAKLYGPAGLDIGAEGPDEIAASIIAEVLATSRSRGAGFLRERPGPIHEPNRSLHAAEVP
ncbi:MAG: XdhC family protein [Actinobacteria bacterium]|nr:XdhC family protein [Actinomycetota bacterium]